MENEEKVLIPIDKYNKIKEKSIKWDNAEIELISAIKTMLESRDIAITVTTKHKTEQGGMFMNRFYTNEVEINTISITKEVKKLQEQNNFLQRELNGAKLECSLQRDKCDKVMQSQYMNRVQLSEIVRLRHEHECKFDLIEDVKKFNKLPWYKKIFCNFEFDEDAFK